MRGARWAAWAATALLPACLSAPEFDEDRLLIEGQVYIGDAPASGASQTLVYMFHPQAGVLNSAVVDENGRYAIHVRAQAGVCQTRLFGFTFDRPFPIESDLTEAVAPGTLECSGVLDGPDVRIPASPPVLRDVSIRGVATVAGFAVPVQMRLRLQSLAFGPVFLDTTVSEDGGEYVLEAKVPEYYCDNLTIQTNPAADQVIGVPGCGDSLVDIAL
ncbi:MAG: hypothetical protein AAF389_06945 [Gemmatimonadota bacterium]